MGGITNIITISLFISMMMIELDNINKDALRFLVHQYAIHYSSGFFVVLINCPNNIAVCGPNYSFRMIRVVKSYVDSVYCFPQFHKYCLF